LKNEDWELAGEWFWENRDFYNGLSVLPYDAGSYIQAPFEDCTKEEYDRLFSKLSSIDLSRVVELQDDTNLSGELACAGGACEIK
jgi:ribonucleoside-diphosphate reductase alpha chain